MIPFRPALPYFLAFGTFATGLAPVAADPLPAPDLARGDHLGVAVVLDGDTLVGGSDRDDTGGANAGSVRIYHPADAGTEPLRRYAFDAAAGDRFGFALALDGDLLAVGAPDEDSGVSSIPDAGSVYIFARDHGGPGSWGHGVQIRAVDAAPGDEFGFAVALSGNLLAIGARSDDDDGSFSGSVYVYGRTTSGAWGFEQKLTPSDGAQNKGFGNALALDGDTLVVGMSGDDRVASNSGAVYVFERVGAGAPWLETRKIKPADAEASDFFATSLALDGDTLVVGSFREDDGGPDAGAVYVFERDLGGPDAWGQATKLVGPGPGALLGRSVDLEGGTLVAGAPEAEVAGLARAGVVLVAERDGGGWSARFEIVSDAPATDSRFGYSVALGGAAGNRELAIGERDADTACPSDPDCNSGAVHLVALDRLGCTDDDFADGAIDPAWTLVGVGNANQQAAVETNGVLELTADGATAFYGADNAGFLYQPVEGDFRLEATIDGTAMTTGGLYRKAGLMVRESLDPWAVRLIAQLAPFWENRDETHLQFVAREAYGEPGRLPVATDVVGVPRVVRLAIERRGDTLFVEYSTDGGVTWIQPTTGLGGSIVIPNLASTLLVGLDMVSNDISTTSTAEFDDVSICPLEL